MLHIQCLASKESSNNYGHSLDATNNNLSQNNVLLSHGGIFSATLMHSFCNKHKLQFYLGSS